MDLFLEHIFLPIVLPVLVSAMLAVLNALLERIHPELSIQLVSKQKDVQEETTVLSRADIQSALQLALSNQLAVSLQPVVEQLKTVLVMLDRLDQDIQRLEVLLRRLESRDNT